MSSKKSAVAKARPRNVTGTFTARPADLRLVRRELGKSGTIIQSGLITTPEYNNKLTGVDAIKVFDEMRFGDPILYAALRTVLQVLLAAVYEVRSYDDDPVHQEQRDFIEKVLFEDMKMTWTDLIRHSFLGLVHGRTFFEIIWDLYRKDGRIGIERLAPRSAETIYTYDVPMPPELGGPYKRGIIQTPLDGPELPIPWDKLFVLVNDKEFDNWEGQSIIRPAYSAWFYKKVLQKIDALAAERHGLGVILTRASKDASPETKAALIEMSRELRANEGLSSNLEGTKEDMDLEMLDMKASSLKDLQPAIKQLNEEMLTSLFANNLILGGGSSNSGSWAMAQDRSNLQYLSLRPKAMWLCENIDLQLIKPLIDMNWPGNDGHYPYMQVSKIGSVNVLQDLQAYKTGVEAGAVRPTPKDEEHFRNEADWPENDSLEAMPEVDKTVVDPAQIETPAPAVANAAIATKQVAISDYALFRALDKIEQLAAS